MQKKRCSTCKQDKPLSEFHNHIRKYTGRDGVPYTEPGKQNACKLCQNSYKAKKYGMKPRDEYNRERRLRLWGDVCEMYVNNPNLTIAEIAKHFGVEHSTVSDIISAYLGNGTPVYVHITPDD